MVAPLDAEVGRADGLCKRGAACGERNRRLHSQARATTIRTGGSGRWRIGLSAATSASVEVHSSPEHGWRQAAPDRTGLRSASRRAPHAAAVRTLTAILALSSAALRCPPADEPATDDTLAVDPQRPGVLPKMSYGSTHLAGYLGQVCLRRKRIVGHCGGDAMVGKHSAP